MLWIVFLALALVASLAACSSVYTPRLKVPTDPSTSLSDRLVVLDRWFQTLHDTRRFNGTVLIGTADRILFLKSYGDADPQAMRRLDDRSAFNLASVSKHFTAAAILLLEQDGLLSVNDRIARYLPELSFYGDVTVEHLLHHTSGIADYMRLTSKHHKDDSLFTTADLIELYSSVQPELEFAPGARFQYSNTGYVLLAEIVARVSGQSFEAFMQSRVFEPSGMRDSRVFNLLSASEPENRVFGFRWNRLVNRDARTLNDLNHFDGVVGDGGVYSTATDLHIWHRVLLSGSLIPTARYANAYLSGRLNDGSLTHYGYGWFIKPGGRVEHAGGWLGFASYLYRDLESGHVIVVLDNSTNAIRVGSAGFRFNSIGLNLQAFLESLPADGS